MVNKKIDICRECSLKLLGQYDKNLEKELRSVFKPLIKFTNRNAMEIERMFKSFNNNFIIQDKINKAFLKQIDCLAKHILMLKKSKFGKTIKGEGSSDFLPPHPLNKKQKLIGGKHGK